MNNTGKLVIIRQTGFDVLMGKDEHIKQQYVDIENDMSKGQPVGVNRIVALYRYVNDDLYEGYSLSGGTV